MKSKKQKWIVWVTAVCLAVVFALPVVQSVCEIPDSIHMTEGEKQTYSFILPMKVTVEEQSACASSSMDETLGKRSTTLSSGTEGETTIRFSLLGLIPVKSVRVQVDSPKRLIPGGQSIGLTMFTEGVFVVDTTSVLLPGGGSTTPGKDAGIEAGDCILSINGQEINSSKELLAVTEKSEGKLTLKIRRDEMEMTVELDPAEDENGQRKLGLWVRDSTAGIGTLSYVDPEQLTFGALGHAVVDADTGKLLPIRSGKIYAADIIGVQMGTRGEAGELHGVFAEEWGMNATLKKNTEFGVYGTVEDWPINPLYPNGLEIAEQNEVRVGKASILCTVDETGVREFDCEILKVTPQLSGASRSMVIEITDEELLSVTGGIVQGMSGSPILQNGKIVGAVTHVYLSDPKKGYGIYIRWMLNTQ